MRTGRQHGDGGYVEPLIAEKSFVNADIERQITGAMHRLGDDDLLGRARCRRGGECQSNRGEQNSQTHTFLLGKVDRPTS